MKQVYESNPALGDPMSIQGQLTDNGQRLDKLRAEQKKYQGITNNDIHSKHLLFTIFKIVAPILVSCSTEIHFYFLGYA